MSQNILGLLTDSCEYTKWARIFIQINEMIQLWEMIFNSKNIIANLISILITES